jgi:hypothetical protein
MGGVSAIGAQASGGYGAVLYANRDGGMDNVFVVSFVAVLPTLCLSLDSVAASCCCDCPSHSYLVISGCVAVVNRRYL